MASYSLRPRSRDDFRVAVICALPLEADLVYKQFEKSWTKEGIDLGKAQGDQNAYTLGVIGKHNVVLVHMPGMGTVSAAAVSAGIRSSFERIEIAFVVGICGASPTHPETQEPVKIGDCILSTVVVEYDFGKQYEEQFIRKSDIHETHGRANPTIRSLLNQLQISGIRQDISDNLYQNLESLRASFPGALSDKPNRPRIHFGRIGSASTVVKSSNHRDKLSAQDKIVGFEMEGAGIWDNLPTIILKSVCDYADENKNDDWQPYAAATAAAGLKAILQYRSTSDNPTRASQVGVNLPYYAVAYFVARNDIQKKLFGWLLDHARQEKMVLLGMGGAGKSQLAMACCKEAVGSQRFATVLWLDASSVLSIEQSIKVVLTDLGEAQSVSLDAEENVAVLTKALQRRNGPFFAVYDNYDTPDVFCQIPITNYIPKAEHGKILFTSRHTDSERLGHCIKVTRMSDDESLELLLKRPLRDEIEQAIGLQIVAELGYLPLALDQASAYIRARNLSLHDFMRHFKHRRKTILQEVPHHWEYKRSMTSGEQETLLSAWTTWELSYSQLSGAEQIKQDKGHFLTLCAFFALSSISKDYFESYCETSSAKWTSILMTNSEWDEFLFDDLVGECRKLSLFQNDEPDSHKSASVSLHPLIRDWLKLRNTDRLRQEAAQEFTRILIFYAETIDFHVLELVKRQQLLANMFSCMEEDERFQAVTSYDEVEFAHYAGRFAIIFGEGGFYDEAEKLYKRTLATYKNCWGDKDLDTLRGMSNLALCYGDQGRYDEAKVLLEKVLAGRRELLEPKDYDTLQTMESLALNANFRGRYDEAEVLYNEVLVARREQLGDKHPDTLHLMHNLAANYTEQHRYDDAEILHKEALAGRREQLGDKHPDTLASMQSLAITYDYQDRFDEAETLNNEVVAARRDQLGSKHPQTLYSLHMMAIIYRHQGKLDESGELYNKVLTDRRDQLGPKHIETLRTMGNLSLLCQCQDKFDEAEELLAEAVDGYIEVVGADHPETLQLSSRLKSLRIRDQQIAQPSQNVDTSTEEMQPPPRKRAKANVGKKLLKWSPFKHDKSGRQS